MYMSSIRHFVDLHRRLPVRLAPAVAYDFRSCSSLSVSHLKHSNNNLSTSQHYVPVLQSVQFAWHHCIPQIGAWLAAASSTWHITWHSHSSGFYGACAAAVSLSSIITIDNRIQRFVASLHCLKVASEFTSIGIAIIRWKEARISWLRKSFYLV